MYGFPPHLSAYLLSLELTEFLGYIHGYQFPEESEAAHLIDEIGEVVDMLDRLQRSCSGRRLAAVRARVLQARGLLAVSLLAERHRRFAVEKIDRILDELSEPGTAPEPVRSPASTS